MPRTARLFLIFPPARTRAPRAARAGRRPLSGSGRRRRAGRPACRGDPQVRARAVDRRRRAGEIAPFADDWAMRGLRRARSADGRGPASISPSACYSLQWINDLPGALVQIRRLLKPDGLFVAALFGGGTLSELRDAFAHAESADPWRHQPAGVALRRCARSGRAAAARGFCPARRRCRAADGALWRFLRPGARPARPWPDQCDGGAQPRSLCAATPWRRCWRITPPITPMRTANCGRVSRRSISPAGRRMKASRSRSSPAAPRRGWPRRWAPSERPLKA